MQGFFRPGLRPGPGSNLQPHILVFFALFVTYSALLSILNMIAMQEPHVLWHNQIALFNDSQK